MGFRVLRRHGRANVVLLFVAVLASTGAVAQFDNGAAGVGQPIEPVANLVHGPMVPGRAGLDFGVSVLETYDDDIAGTAIPGQYVSGWYTEVRPSVTLVRPASRSAITLSYQPGFRMYSAGPGLNTVTHNLTGNISLSPSRHWRLTGGGTFSYLPDTEALFYSAESAPKVDAISTLVTPASLPRNGVTTAIEYLDAQYQWSLRSYVAVGATYTRQSFNSSQFLGTQGYTTRGSYNYRISPRVTAAATYQFNQFWWQQGFGGSVHHAFMLGASFHPNNRMSFSASLGPSISQFSQQSSVQLNPLLAFLLGTQVLQQRTDRRELGWTGTAQFGWHLSRTSLMVRYGRGANSGGGLYGSVESQTVGAGVQRRLSRTANLNGDMTYVRTSFINAINLPFGDVAHLAFRVRYDHPLTHHSTGFVQYQYDRQMAGSSVLKADRNVVSIGFNFSRAGSSTSY